jgi:hypothetical protein
MLAKTPDLHVWTARQTPGRVRLCRGEGLLDDEGLAASDRVLCNDPKVVGRVLPQTPATRFTKLFLNYSLFILKFSQDKKRENVL